MWSQRGGLENRLGSRPRGFESLALRQEQPHSNMWLLYFCYKGVAGIIFPTQVVEQRRSTHWKTLKRNKGIWKK